MIFKTLLFVFIILIGSPFFIPKFKVGDKVYNTQFKQVKKITQIEIFNYRYQILKKSKWTGDYYTRIVWFDRNHKILIKGSK